MVGCWIFITSVVLPREVNIVVGCWIFITAVVLAREVNIVVGWLDPHQCCYLSQGGQHCGRLAGSSPVLLY